MAHLFERVLKQITLIAVIFAILPVFYIFSYFDIIEPLSMRQVPLRNNIIINCMTLLMTGYLSYIVEYIKDKTHVKLDKTIKKYLMLIPYILVIGLPMIFRNVYYGPIRQDQLGYGLEIVMGLLIIAVAIIFGKGYSSPYEKILDKKLGIFSVTVYFISVVIFKSKFLMMSFIFLCSLYLLVKSQENYKEMAVKMVDNTPMKNQISKKSVMGVLCVIFVCIVLYPLTNFISLAIYQITKGTVFLLMVLSKLLSFILPMAGSINPEVEQVKKQQSQQGSAIHTELFVAVVGGLLSIIIIYKNWDKIRKTLKYILAWIYTVVYNFCKALNKYFFGIKNEKHIMGAEYEDVIEEMDDEQTFQLKSRKLPGKKEWHKKAKHFLKHELRPEHFVKGYRLILEKFYLLKVPKIVSNTPRENEQLIEKMHLEPSIEKETRGYEKICYGEQSASQEDIECLGTVLKTLLKK